MIEQVKRKLKELEEVRIEGSKEAKEIVKDLLERYDETSKDMDRAIFEQVDGSYVSIYSTSALDYIKETRLYDFTEAIELGNKNVCSIASHYLTNEVYNILSQLNVAY